MKYEDGSRFVEFCTGLVPYEFIHSNYRQTSNIRHTLVGNQIVDHLDIVEASPVGAAPSIFSFST